MSENSDARAVLCRALEETIRETARSGASGGSGRAAIYAPQIVALSNAIKALDEAPVRVEAVDRMAAVRAAKAAKNS